MEKKMPFWGEKHLEKKGETRWVRMTFGSSDIEKKQTVGARNKFRGIFKTFQLRATFGSH